jgi:hypothetical protein
LSGSQRTGSESLRAFDPLKCNKRIVCGCAARVLHSLRCNDRSCPVSNRGPIAPETNCLLVQQQPDSVVEGDAPAPPHTRKVKASSTRRITIQPPTRRLPLPILCYVRETSQKSRNVSTHRPGSKIPAEDPRSRNAPVLNY